MIRPLSVLLLSSLGLIGCARDDVVMRTPVDHPAHAEAESAPLPPASTTLVITEPVTATPAPTMPMHPEPMGTMEGEHQHDHAAPQPGDAAAPAAPPLYACPMHPQVTSDDPAARCPQCGMKLKAVKPQEATP